MGKLKKKIEFTLEQETQIKNFENYVKNHSKPVTRRQFLASGAILGAASVILPSSLSLISQFAYAADTSAVCSSAKGKMPGFLTVNMNGGSSLAGNALALDTNGEFLSTYRPVGLGSRSNAINTSTQPFGNTGPSFYSLGGFLTGLKTTAPQAVLDKTAALLFCVRTTDDSTSNQLAADSLIAKSKIGAGAILPPLGRNRNQPAIVAAAPALDVGRVEDIQNAISIQGAIKALSNEQKEKILKMVQRMTASQTEALANDSGGVLLGELIKDATGTNTNIILNPSVGTDPRVITGLQTIWNFNDTSQLRDASVSLNCINGNTVAGYSEIGGCDYHGNGRPVQDARDSDAGLRVGRMLSTANALNEKVCVVVTSDGSVNHSISDFPGAPAVGDQGTHGMAYAFFFDPTGRPAQSSSQVGSFNASSTASGDRLGVNESTLIGGSPAHAVAAIVANYLAFSDKIGLFESIAPRVFSAEDLASKIIKIS